MPLHPPHQTPLPLLTGPLDLLTPQLLYIPHLFFDGGGGVQPTYPDLPAGDGGRWWAVGGGMCIIHGKIAWGNTCTLSRSHN